MDWQFAIYSFSSLLAILNPFGAVPVFLSLTKDQSPAQQARTSRIVVMATGVILLVFAVLGHRLLSVFGIDIPAFRAGGGILLLLMGISMLHGSMSSVKHTDQEAEEAVERDSVAIVPLALPILSGPGAISTIILLSDKTKGVFGWLSLMGSLVLCMVITLLMLNTAQRIQRIIGRTGLNVISRIMGLILVAVAVQFIADGMAALLPGLRPGGVLPPH